MADQDLVRATHSKLQAYFDNLPTNQSLITSPSVWDMHNSLMDEAAKITDDLSFHSYKVTPRKSVSSVIGNHTNYRTVVDTMTLRQNASIAIADLKAKYLQGEPVQSAAREVNTTAIQISPVFNNTQNTAVEVAVTIALEMGPKIDAQLEKFEAGTPERTFLEKIRAGLRSVTSISELITLILSTAASMGLAAEQLMKILGQATTQIK